MDDDLNTPGALAVLFELAKGLQREGNRLVHKGQTQASSDLLWQQWQTLVHLAEVLGLEVTPDGGADATAVGLDETAIAAGRSLTIADLIQQRQVARQQRDFATADDIRDRLAAMGIAVVDQPDGEVRWHRQQINDSEPNYCP